MSVVEKFNSLIGKQVTRKEIQNLLNEAKDQEQFAIVNRLENVLASNKKVQDFRFSKLSAPAIEVVPESFINCLDCHEENETYIGLGKAVSPNEIYQMITDRMIEKIREANTPRYVQKWDAKVYGKGYLLPFNFVSKKMYRGINRYLLTDFNPLKNPFFLTFKQIEELGGKLKKGSVGLPVVYFTELYKYHNPNTKIDIGSYNLKKFIALLEENRNKIPEFKAGLTAQQIANNNKLPILKYYKVFNGKDVEGIDFDLDNFKHGYIENELPATEEHKMPIAEAIIKAYPSPQPKLGFGGGRAYYRPGSDHIQMPHIVDFETSQDYYRTLFHEYGHSTGYSKRLARDLTGRKGSKKYAFEELIAEFTATFLSAEAGILWHTNTNHPAYLKSWNSALTHLQDDNRFLMRAATQAQIAADFVLQYDKKGDPKYFEELKKTEKTAKPKVTVTKQAKPTKKAPASTNAKTPVKPLAKKAVKPTVTRKRKPEPKKQLELFGMNGRKKESGLKAPVVEAVEPVNEPLPVVQQRSRNPRALNIGAAGNEGPASYFTVLGEEGKFLQAVERKPHHSVVITMDGEQGAGKTTTLYKFMNAFATPGNSCLFISGEEHPQSSLAIEKRDKYLSQQAIANTDIVAEVNSMNDLYDLVKDYEIIFIDSWQKLVRMVGTIRLDEDLRKKFNGKVFVIIFQQTTDGRTKGGSEIVFDGDIIIKMYKQPSFNDNYAAFDKNRYTKIPIENIRYNIANGTVYNPNETNDQDAENIEIDYSKLNFETI
ncbi:zincin-like metallopeptidase domain-containing protein [Flavobacterium rakeshii]|uniref:zincin-like metallopeptidase domain-containing protein n=1 Tax=Flavobacterium rakeshii TaxID=1038845 RepID=UPI002E7C13ED|nr:zincin-like metallopeptidase domain-containing protein [Flavobacterium rakeshii]MEE1897074.1 zincin-like metallopeptidase domain-containing protein [Flavobacterium rakeshii]